MLVAISVNHAIHQREHGEALREGFEKHGIETVFTPGDVAVDGASFHCTWSVRGPKILEWSNRNGKPFLCCERGHVGDRMNWTSVGWNGLGHRGRYAQIEDGGERWNRHWQHLLQPWTTRQGTALVLGQCTGDSSLYGLKEGFEAWATEQCHTLKRSGYQVRYRMHPLMKRRGSTFCPVSAHPSPQERLWDDLQWASLAVSYNSTAGVEAVLAGVPTVTLDEGAMAWPVSGHTLFDRVQPDREAWCHRLAWTQFCLDEIRSGFCWECVSQVVGVSA